MVGEVSRSFVGMASLSAMEKVLNGNVVEECADKDDGHEGDSNTLLDRGRRIGLSRIARDQTLPRS